MPKEFICAECLCVVEEEMDDAYCTYIELADRLCDECEEQAEYERQRKPD